MKKIYLSLLLLAPGFAFADDVLVEQEKIEQTEVKEQVEQTEQDVLQEVDGQVDLSSDLSDEVLAKTEALAKKEEDLDRAMFDLDDDDFFGDALDKMIEMGAVNEEIEVKPMPVWKVWLLRFGSTLFAKYDVFKKFIIKRYDYAKYVVAAAWAKATGKKPPKRPKTKKTKNKSKKKKTKKAA